ncbi:unnamed protein product [Thelazia callipaeda]|uniref:KH domain-containing protein n=1 Tax=Thelazia callipaeda TaxID=103827 RepID=A0A0N5D3E2_THECL|nr:unnamed protein product [Thelazia callipaeda]
MRMLDSIQAQYPGKFRQAQTLLTKEIDRVWSDIYLHAVQDYQVQPVDSQNVIILWISLEKCKLIGRILGPRGMSVRQLEAQSDCQILIRGKGSIKDPRREARLRHRFGWEHLTEPLHVLVTATDISRERCTQKLANGVQKIKTLLKSNNDEYKRLQLVQLAIINGTYRPMRAQK